MWIAMDVLSGCYEECVDSHLCVRRDVWIAMDVP